LTKDSIYLHAHNNNPISPLSTYANELHKHHYLPKNVSTIFADVRRVPPFNLLEAIYDYDSFAFIQGLHIDDEPRDLYAKSKKFEKAFFQHTNTSKKCIRFFKSIIEPHIEPQQWFKQSLKDFSISDTNVIKTTLATIKTHNEFAYNYIMKTLTRVLEEAISTQNEYSLAMDKAEKTRHTNSPNFVAHKHIYFKAFWIAVNALLMDIYMLCLLFTKNKNEMYITLTGANHTNTIIHAISEPNIVSAFNKDSTITPSDIVMEKRIWKMAYNPKSLLLRFLHAPSHT
jgi:hypothetical protein